MGSGGFIGQIADGARAGDSQPPLAAANYCSFRLSGPERQSPQEWSHQGQVRVVLTPGSAKCQVRSEVGSEKGKVT